MALYRKHLHIYTPMQYGSYYIMSHNPIVTLNLFAIENSIWRATEPKVL